MSTDTDNFIVEIQQKERTKEEWNVLGKKLRLFRKNYNLKRRLHKKKTLIGFSRKVCIDAIKIGETTCLDRRLHRFSK